MSETQSAANEIPGGEWYSSHVPAEHAPAQIETFNDRTDGQWDDWGVSYGAHVTCSCGEHFTSEGRGYSHLDAAADAWLAHVSSHTGGQLLEATDELSQVGTIREGYIAVYIAQP